MAPLRIGVDLARDEDEVARTHGGRRGQPVVPAEAVSVGSAAGASAAGIQAAERRPYDRVGAREERVLQRRAVGDRQVRGRQPPCVVDVAQRPLDRPPPAARRPSRRCAGPPRRPAAGSSSPPRRPTVATSSGRSVRRSMTSASMPCSASDRRRPSARRARRFIAVAIVTSRPSRTTAAWPIGTTSPSPGLALERVEPLVLEEQHRVVVADRRLEQRPARRPASRARRSSAPGSPWNHGVGICEWIAPKRPPPPTRRARRPAARAPARSRCTSTWPPG